MLSKPSTPYQLPQAQILRQRLAEPRRSIQVIAGPRQVGKTTPVQQVIEEAGILACFASADEPTLRGAEWIAAQREVARLMASGEGAVRRRA